MKMSSRPIAKIEKSLRIRKFRSEDHDSIDMYNNRIIISRSSFSEYDDVEHEKEIINRFRIGKKSIDFSLY